MKKKELLLLILLSTLLSCKSYKHDKMNEKQNNSKVMYTYSNNKAYITRNKYTKEAVLNILKNENWLLYKGNTPNSEDIKIPILKGNIRGAFLIKNIDPSKREYFRLVTADKSYVFAENQLPMEGGYNCRDLGGIITKDNKSVKWGKLFRSDDLSKLTDSDLSYLSSIPIKYIIDFRGEDEVKAGPDRIPSSVLDYYRLPVMPGNLVEALNSLEHNIDSMNVVSLMKNINEEFVENPECIVQYKKFFKILQTKEAPILYHCTAGKDRTGFATTLLLFALNVDEKIIEKNYLLSNYFLDNKYKDIKRKGKQYENLVIVRPDYWRAGVNLIRKKYGSVDNYLKDILNVNTKILKDKYLE